MFVSREHIKNRPYSVLKKYLNNFLKEHIYIRCKALKNRKVFFSKLPNSITKRTDGKMRLRCFWVGLDIIKKSDEIKKRTVSGYREYEMEGLSCDKRIVKIHLREEKIKKNKMLFLISTFYKHKKTPPL